METSISDAPRASGYKTDILMKENSVSNKSLLRDSRNYPQKNVAKVNSSFSGVSSSEDEMSKGPAGSGLQYPVADTENQRVNYGKTKEMSHQGQENTDKCHLPSPTRSIELSICDVRTQDQECPVTELGQVVLRPKGARHAHEDRESTPSCPTEESATKDNIAFMITRTAVQVLSRGEVRDIVSRKGEEVQTVNIDAKKETTSQQEGTDQEEPVVCLDKKPVIIIFDEPMDIRSAYKRLSTIFEECDEELERMMTEEKIEEEEEEENADAVVRSNPAPRRPADAAGGPGPGGQAEAPWRPRCVSAAEAPGGPDVRSAELTACSRAGAPSPEGRADGTDDPSESPKKKFKFKFPKKQLAALTQAIRTGTKTGKKTLQVVVYEEEEEDGTLKQHKEAKRFEITRSSPPEDAPQSMLRRREQPGLENSTSPISRTDEIRKNTYRTLDSLEQTIKQLENTISEMSPKALADPSCSFSSDAVASAADAAREACPRPPPALEEAPPVQEPPSSIPSASRKVSWSDGK